MTRKRQDRVLVHPALDDGVDLDRRETRDVRRFDPVEHASEREIDVVHRAKSRIVERIEAHGDARESGGAQRAGLFREQRPVGRQREIDIGKRGQLLDQPLQVLAQQRLAAGQPNFANAELDVDPREPHDFLECQQFRVRKERIVAPENVLRHAVHAAEIAAVGDRDPQVVHRTAALIDERGTALDARRLANECVPRGRAGRANVGKRDDLVHRR